MYVEGRFPSSARLSGELQGDVGDQSLAALYFRGNFFLQAAFMLCNIRDVLEELQHRDYKLCLRHEVQTDTQEQKYLLEHTK